MTSSLAETQVDSLLAQIPLRRLGTPEEIASVVRFLVSEKANYITGERLFTLMAECLWANAV